MWTLCGFVVLYMYLLCYVLTVFILRIQNGLAQHVAGPGYIKDDPSVPRWVILPSALFHMYMCPFYLL